MWIRSFGSIRQRLDVYRTRSHQDSGSAAETGCLDPSHNVLQRVLGIDNAEMVRLLLEFGVGFNSVVADFSGGQPVERIPSSHHAAQRGASVQVANSLLDFGADPSMIWSGYSAYAVARL